MLKSCSSPRIVALRALIDSRAERQRAGRFFTEGLRFVYAALHSRQYPIDEVLYCPELLEGDFAAELLADIRRREIPCIPVAARVFAHLSEAEEPQGIAAVCQIRWERLARLPPDDGICLVALDTIRSPGNLGTILRTMHATGATTLALVGNQIDPFDPRVVRATMGSLFGVRMVRTEPEGFAAWRLRQGVALVGASPDALAECRGFSYPNRCALWLGGERKGLSELQKRSCDQLVRIPMVGTVDSLNVGVAAAVLLYEVYFQRRAGPGAA